MFVVFLFISLGLSLFHVMPQHDVAHRYAPMAEAFAAGNWDYAFHPRIPPLHPVVSGCLVWFLGVSGFWGCKLASSLFFSLSIFPAYGIFSRLFSSRRVALLGAFLTGVCPSLVRLGYSGLRGSMKEFACLLAVYGLVAVYQERRHWLGYMGLLAGCVLLVLNRGDSVLYACLLIFAGLVIELRGGGWKRLPLRSATVIALTLLIVSPYLLYNYRMIGYPVPEMRIGIVLSRLTPWLYNSEAQLRLPAHVDNAAGSNESKSSTDGNDRQKTDSATTDSAQSIAVSAGVNDDEQSQGFWATVMFILGFVDDLLDGVCLFFLVFAIPVIYLRIRQRVWTGAETIVFSAWLAHMLVVIGQILVFDHRLYISDRYLIPAAPLVFGWSGMGVLALVARAGNGIRGYQLSRSMRRVCLFMILLFLLLDAANPMTKDYVTDNKSRRRQASLALAEYIRGDYSGVQHCNRELLWWAYRPNARPAVYSRELKVLGYLAGGQSMQEGAVGYDLEPDYIVSSADDGEPMDGNVADGYVKVYAQEIRGITYFVWKRKLP